MKKKANLQRERERVRERRGDERKSMTEKKPTKTIETSCKIRDHIIDNVKRGES